MGARTQNQGYEESLGQHLRLLFHTVWPCRHEEAPTRLRALSCAGEPARGAGPKAELRQGIRCECLFELDLLFELELWLTLSSATSWLPTAYYRTWLAYCIDRLVRAYEVRL